MEPKVIGVISNNLEIVRKICENREDSTKKVFNDIMTGDVVTNIVETFLDKLDEIKLESVELSDCVGDVNQILKKNKENMEKNDPTKKIVDILKEISATTIAILNKETANPQTPENQGILKGVLGDVKKDNNLKLVLAAALMGKDIVENMLAVAKNSSKMLKGSRYLRELLLGKDNDENGGLVGTIVEMDRRLKKSNINPKKVSELITTIDKILIGSEIVKDLTVVWALGKLALKGLEQFNTIIIDGDKSIINLLININQHEDDVKKGEKSIEKIANVSGKLVLTALAMTAMIVLAIPAMLGAVLTWAFVKVFLALNKQLIDSEKELNKGLGVMKEIMISMVLMGVSMYLMYQAVKNMYWEDVAMVATFILLYSGVVVLINKFSKDINKGAKTMVEMGISFILMSLSMILMVKAVESMSWESFAMALGSIIILSGVALLFNMFSKPIKHGVRSMLEMGAAYLMMSLSMILMYQAVKSFSWKEFGLVVLTIGVLVGLTLLFNIFSKPIEKGERVMVEMGMAYILMGVSMWIMFTVVKNVTWEQLGMVLSMVVVMVGMVVLLNTLSKPVKKGTYTMIEMGIGYILIGLSMMLMYKVTKDVSWERFGMLAANVLLLVGVVVVIGLLKSQVTTGVAMLILMGVGYIIMGVAMMTMYKSIENANWEKFGMLAATVLTLSIVAALIGIPVVAGFVSLGASTMIVMGIGYIAIGIAMMILYKSVESANWEKFGMIAATIGTMGIIAAAMGIPVVAALIGVGSIAMIVMGVGLIALGAGILLFGKWVNNKSIDMVAEGIPRIIKAMTSIFDSDGENGSFGDGLMGIVMGALKLGGAILAAGALIFIGISLGIFALCMKPWSNFDTKSIDNVEYTIGKIYKIFGLDDPQEGGSIGNIGGEILGIIMMALKFGKVLFQMGIVLLVAFTMGLIYDSVMKWKTFDKKSIENFEEAYNNINRIFKLDDDSGSSIGGMFKNLLGLASTALQFGKTLLQMGIIALCMITMDMVYDSLKKWSNFNNKSIKNFENTYKKLNEIFGLDDGKGKSVSGAGKGVLKDCFGLVSMLLKFGKTLLQMGIIALTMVVMNYVFDSLQKWKNFDQKCIDNFETAYLKIKKIFKLDEDGSSGPGGLVEGTFGLMKALIDFGKTFVQMGIILLSMVVMDKVREHLIPWGEFDPTNALTNLDLAVSETKRIFGLDTAGESVSLGDLTGGIIDMALAIIKGGALLIKLGVIMLAMGVMDKIRESLMGWGDITKLDEALGNVDKAIKAMQRIFGLTPPAAPPEEKKESGFWGKLWGGVKKVASSVVNCASGVLNGIGDAASAGGEMAKIQALSMAAGVMKIIIENIQKMSDIKNAEGVVNQFDSLVNKMLRFFRDADKTVWDAVSGIKGCNRIVDEAVSMSRKLNDAEKDILKFNRLTNTIIDTLLSWNPLLFESRIYSISRGLNSQFNALDKPGRNYRNNIDNTIKLFSSMKSLEMVWSGKKIPKSIRSIVNTVNKVEMEKVTALTEMFNAFSKMKEKNIFSSFRDSVDEFTKACIKLVEAINGNTDALNNDDTSDSNNNSSSNSSSGQNERKGTSVNITNIDELAQAIASRVRSGGRGVNSVSTVDLRINGEGGNRWVIQKNY